MIARLVGSGFTPSHWDRPVIAVLNRNVVAAVANTQPQVEIFREACKEAVRSAPVALRRQKYTARAAPPVLARVIQIMARASGWPIARMIAAGSGTPPPTANCTPLNTAQAIPEATDRNSIAPMAIARSRKNPATGLSGAAGSGGGPCASLTVISLGSDVEIGSLQRVGIDEFASR